jgi:hypothetical protein
MSTSRAPSVSLTDLAALLARAYLRLLDKSRTSAVSCPDQDDVSLGVPALPRPDERVVRDVRRAS